jgi:hypothetical protein
MKSTRHLENGFSSWGAWGVKCRLASGLPLPVPNFREYTPAEAPRHLPRTQEAWKGPVWSLGIAVQTVLA